MENPILSLDGVIQIFRWIHFMAGIVWIGHLYYFNFSQTPFFGEADAAAKSACIRGLVPRALWWFRWGAAFTFFSGLMLLHFFAKQMGGWNALASPFGIWILIGSGLGSIMAANVWFVIWPKQKIVIASANAVVGGGQADPRAADAAARASVASRTNVLFSIPMLFLMGASRHLPFDMGEAPNFIAVFWAMLILILVLELNALFGKLGPMKSIAGVIHLGLALTAVIYGLTIYLI